MAFKNLAQRHAFFAALAKKKQENLLTPQTQQKTSQLGSLQKLPSAIQPGVEASPVPQMPPVGSKLQAIAPVQPPKMKFGQIKNLLKLKKK